ncbi:hypothetical protein LOK49_LG07G01689 [Camellia lanceoleosa]|uniref:Uncharacterized protein n=1 Tax=Camellia lanceoleosa TaxID=1840588 RepID=A0ACC0GXH5_9ERIC|nr:hypothetical protein LOK49_LG07G01689 [Camellia lanceoleosa]
MPNPSKSGKQPWIGPLIVYMNHILQRFKDRCADEFVTVQVDPNKLVLELVLDDLLKEYPDIMLVGYRANHETKSNYLLSQLAESLSRPL